MRLATVVLSMVSVFMTAMSAASARAANVTLTAASGSAAAGGEFQATISASGGAAVGAMEFQLVWDPAVLEFKSVDKGKTLEGGVLLETNLNAPGRLSVAWAAGDSVPADGPLLAVRFAVKGGADAKSTLGLEQVRAWGPDKAHHDSDSAAAPAASHHLIDVQAKAQPGEFTVAPAGTNKNLLYVVLAVVLFLVLLIVLWRRKKARI